MALDTGPGGEMSFRVCFFPFKEEMLLRSTPPPPTYWGVCLVPDCLVV